MIVTPVLDHGIDFLASDLVRSPGLHASEVYGDLFKQLEPKRYDIRDKVTGEPLDWNPVLLAIGTAWEKHFEYLLAKAGIVVERPDEFMSEDGIAFSPDLIQFNGVTRIWEIKYTSMSTKDLPVVETNCLPPKFDKYDCVTPEVELLTSDLRRVRAEDIRVGMSVLAFDEHSRGHFTKRRMQHSVVTAVRRITKPCSRLHLADGTTIDVSNDHQWFAKPSRTLHEQWMKTSTLLRTDKTWPGKPRASNAFLARVFAKRWVSQLTDLERGWLAGLADGEGCLTGRTGSGCLKITIAQNQGPVLNKLVDLLAKDGYVFTLSGAKCVSVNIANKEDVFRFLSTMRPVRLLQKFVELPTLPGLTTNPVQVIDRTDLGEQVVYAIETDAATYIAEGLASHNCQMKLYAYWLGINHGTLAVVLNHQPWDPQFRMFNLEWNERELADNHKMCMGHAKHKGLLK